MCGNAEFSPQEDLQLLLPLETLPRHHVDKSRLNYCMIKDMQSLGPISSADSQPSSRHVGEAVLSQRAPANLPADHGRTSEPSHKAEPCPDQQHCLANLQICEQLLMLIVSSY